VIGIWPTNTESNFINCAHLGTHAMKLATGDDDGAVKLFKFPCLQKAVGFIRTFLFFIFFNILIV
jgi:hypothetical protein